MINQQRLVQTFLDLVQIDSPTGNEQKIAEVVSERLQALGGNVERDRYGNIIAKFDGVGEPLMLNAHLDTVEPGRGIKPVVDGDKITSDGTTILGSDCKSGLSIILEALTSVREDQVQHVPLEVVFTLGEEDGLHGATHLDYSKITAKRAVAFDEEGEVGNINLSAAGYNRIDVTIIGRAAHAGIEPEKGISAIRIAAEIISQLHVGRVDDETTANIGLIVGGTARNAVSEEVIFKGEIRSRDVAKLETHTKHFQDVFAKVMQQYPEAKIVPSIKHEFNPYHFEKDNPVVQQVLKIYEELNITPRFNHSGGGTDVNIFNTQGINAVVVGAGMYNAHTTREYTYISNMLQAAQVCEKLALQ